MNEFPESTSADPDEARLNAAPPEEVGDAEDGGQRYDTLPLEQHEPRSVNGEVDGDTAES